MNPESKFSKKLIAKFPPGTHAQRIESSSGSGVPDINLCLDGHEFWIETKIQTPGGHVLLRPYQWAWISRRVAAVGRGYVVAESADSRIVLIWHFGDIEVIQHGEYLRITSNPVRMANIAAAVKLLFRQ